MKRICAILLILALLLSLLAACGSPAAETPTETLAPAATPTPTPAPTPTPTPAPTETPAPVETAAPPAAPQAEKIPMAVLSVTRRARKVSAGAGLEPWSAHWYDHTRITADLKGDPALAWSLIIGDNTEFTGSLPEGYDPQALVEWGKAPGLSVDVLHAHGFTGKGAVIAYIDQAVSPHEEFDRENIHITNTGESRTSMHGPGVLSLLAGETIGTAPEAEVYFFGCDSGMGDTQLHEAEALYRVIALNETLPEGEKITMVGFSDNIDIQEAYTAEFRAAVKACEAAGIMVWFCWEYGAATYLPFADKNNPFNLMVDQWGGGMPSLVYVPASGRTVAAQLAGAQYTYWSTAGLSWTMPYVMGLYAIALSIDPTLTKDELRMMLKMSAYPFGDGLQMVSPIGFVASVLEQVGRNEEAGVLRAEYRTQQNVLCAVVDTDALTPEDLQAVYDGLAWITDAMVLVMDASCFGGGSAVYDTIEGLSGSGLTLAGIQLFGDLPAPEGDSLPVWRLDLEPGEYGAFFRGYLEAVRAGEPYTLEEGTLFPLSLAAMVLSEAEGKLEK